MIRDESVVATCTCNHARMGYREIIGFVSFSVPGEFFLPCLNRSP